MACYEGLNSVLDLLISIRCFVKLVEIHNAQCLMYRYERRNVVPGEMRKLRPTAFTFFTAIAFNQKIQHVFKLVREYPGFEIYLTFDSIFRITREPRHDLWVKRQNNNSKDQFKI